MIFRPRYDRYDTMTVTEMYRTGAFFLNKHEAQGAFELAAQQGLDGFGSSVQAWMGLTDEEFKAWMQKHTLPPKKKPKAVSVKKAQTRKPHLYLVK